jgi:hypothetical protein
MPYGRALPVEDAIPGCTTHLAFESLDFMVVLAALVLRLRVNLPR